MVTINQTRELVRSLQRNNNAIREEARLAAYREAIATVVKSVVDFRMNPNSEDYYRIKEALYLCPCSYNYLRSVIAFTTHTKILLEGR